MLTPKKRPKSPYWILRGTINGKRLEISRKWTTAADARRAIPGVIAEHSADPVSSDDFTFRQALKIYRAAKPRARFLAPIERFFGDCLVSDINNAEMRRAANALYPEASPATIRRNLYTPVKAILNLAAEEDLCAAPRLKSPAGGRKRTNFFTPEQADTLIENLAGENNSYLAPLATFLLGQGCRMSEALTMDGTDIHLDLKMAILRDTKNGEERQVTLIPRVIAAMSRLPTIGEPGAVFRRMDGMPFRSGKDNGGQIKQPFARAVKAAGLDTARFTPHVCRHSWATWFYAQQLDVLRLQNEGGWKSAEWQRYTKLGTPDLGAAARQRGWNFDLLGENRGNDAATPSASRG